METQPHKAGFVNIIGKPNARKSTLMNALTGENLAIVTAKAQTTRHRIMGIISGENFQIVYSDTPGIIEPKYELHRRMMGFVDMSIEDADLLLLVVDVKDEEPFAPEVMERLAKAQAPIILLVNKIDLSDQASVVAVLEKWQAQLTVAAALPISALERFNTDQVLKMLLEHLPEHPAYFPKDEVTDKSERFFAAEIIREKIFQFYEQEIPYCCEVVIASFKEAPEIIRISAEILVEHTSQRSIVIGKGGSMLKKVGIEARKDMEAFFGKKIFLEQYVRVEEDWRKHKQKLDRFGYHA
jgi:GTP-binding protein Era